MQVTFISLKLIRGKYFYTLLSPFNMKRMKKKINLVYKIKKEKTVKSGVVDRL